MTINWRRCLLTRCRTPWPIMPANALRARMHGSGLLSLSYDRQQELEADHIGVFLMTFAGYDPYQAVAFWQEMQQAGRIEPPEILSDHPSDAHRMQQLQAWAPLVHRRQAGVR